MIISFLGHRNINNKEKIKQLVEKAVKENIPENDELLFYCGGYGDYDELCASVCRNIKKTLPTSKIIFITPYISPSQQQKIKYLLETKLYDEVIYPPIENTPQRFAISKRNEWIVERSDLIIAYIEHSFGGAYKTFLTAKRKNKKIISISLEL